MAFLFKNRIQKLALKIRRIRLGRQFQHQYTCHPSFNIQRGDHHHQIIWKGKHIADVGNIKTLKHTFKNHCFIIASGPSLNEIDFQRLAPFDCISLNCSIRKLTEQHIEPKHCVIVDRRAFENDWDCIEASILSGANCYFSAVGISRICEQKPELLKQNNIYLIEAIGRQFNLPRPTMDEFQQRYQNDPDIFLDPKVISRGTIGYSLNAEKGFFNSRTVAAWAVQLAPYLGYKHLNIIGMDLGGTGKSYFDSSNHTAIPYDFIDLYDPYIKVCFEQAQRASKIGGFQIYNLSQHSTLPDEIVPKISFEQALEQLNT